MDWYAEITNDPDNDYALYIEISRGSDSWGRISKDATGQLILTVYAGDERSVPVGWLKELCERAEAELQIPPGT